MLKRKIVVLGEMAVGKTSILQRLTVGHFQSNYKGTIGNDIYTHEVRGLGDGQGAIELSIWDTDGGLGAAVFHKDVSVIGARAAIVVGDVTRPRTLQTMVTLARSCDEHLPGRHVHFLLNKSDLLSQVDDVEIPAELSAFHHPITMVSAKSGENVKEAFFDAANAILRRSL